jgi:2-methylcitrate dehydratase PrpD
VGMASGTAQTATGTAAGTATGTMPAATTRQLASVLAGVRFEELPQPVVERTKELFLDWVAAALAGRGARPVRILEGFAEAMGPETGPSEVLTSRRRTSPLFAALVNGAASHVVEQDDLHSAAVLHPGTVVFPAVLAAAQQAGASGRDLLTAAVVGYEVGARVGAFLGRSHYRVFHTTGTAGTLAAAAGSARLLGAGEAAMLDALGSAGTQAAGLWEFLRDAADSKQLHTAKAAADGLLAAYIARDGFTGATRILEGERGMAAGMSTDADPTKLTSELGTRWAVLDTSFKFHASCRHTHPAADALLQAVREHGLRPDRIAQVRAHVYQAALDVLGPAARPRTVHQSKFSMGFVLGLIAIDGRAGVTEFTEERLHDPEVLGFLDRVEMVLDPAIDTAYPGQWMGAVDVETVDGERFTARVEVPKGDPGNTLSREELEDKAQRLAAFQGGALAGEMRRVIDRVWKLDQESDVRDLLPPRTA